MCQYEDGTFDVPDWLKYLKDMLRINTIYWHVADLGEGVGYKRV